MLMALVAVLCPIGAGACVEEIVTDQASFQGCAIRGEILASAWMQQSPTYRTGWTLTRWKCAPGDYKKARGA